MNKRKEIGAFGENLAIEFLNKNHYDVVDRNYRCGKLGEIDIIARKENVYVFIEVKTRRSLAFGRPVEAITLKKKLHIHHVAQCYIKANRLYNCNFRYDAIEVLIQKNQKTEINHIENIYEIG